MNIRRFNHLIKPSNLFVMARAIILGIFFLLTACTQKLPVIKINYEGASVVATGHEITVSTGVVEGKWKWTGKSLVTTGFKNLASGTEWISKDNSGMADWDIRLPGMEKARLVSLEASESDDDKLTSKHISVVATVEYPDANIVIQYIIWAYPGAPGLRTQLLAKSTEGFVPDTTFNSNTAQTDHLPVDLNSLNFQTVGFYNDHDGRNSDSLQMVDVIDFEKTAATDSFPLANMLFAYNNTEGIGLVKESHKVVNEESVNTGVFYYDENGIYNTAALPLSVLAADIQQGR